MPGTSSARWVTPSSFSSVSSRMITSPRSKRIAASCPSAIGALPARGATEYCVACPAQPTLAHRAAGGMRAGTYFTGRRWAARRDEWVELLSWRGFGQAVAEGVGGGLGTPAQVELAVEVGDVVLDGADADAEVGGNLSIGPAGGDQAQDSGLTPGQGVRRCSGAARRGGSGRRAGLGQRRERVRGRPGRKRHSREGRPR